MKYKQMVEDIHAILETDQAYEFIDFRRMPNSKPFTQEEAEQMSDMLGHIYKISHCITCTACGSKYR